MNHREDEKMENEQDQPMAGDGSTFFTDQNPECENKSSVEQRTESDVILDKSMRYEYYVHYQGVDRRLERWVTEHYIRVDDTAEIERQKEEVKDREK